MTYHTIVMTRIRMWVKRLHVLRLRKWFSIGKNVHENNDTNAFECRWVWWTTFFDIPKKMIDIHVNESLSSIVACIFCMLRFVIESRMVSFCTMTLSTLCSCSHSLLSIHFRIKNNSSTYILLLSTQKDQFIHTHKNNSNIHTDTTHKKCLTCNYPYDVSFFCRIHKHSSFCVCVVIFILSRSFCFSLLTVHLTQLTL